MVVLPTPAVPQYPLFYTKCGIRAI